MAAHRQHGPRFLWTGLMILGPVLALGGFGIWQLRRERAAAVVAAGDEAELHARQVLAAGRFLLTSPEWPVSTPLDGGGEPLFAPLYAEVPEPVASPSPEAVELRRLASRSRLTAAERSVAAAQLAARSEGATASGLPLRPLAWRLALSSGLKAGRPTPELADLAEQLIESALRQPSIFTVTLIDEAAPHLDEVAAQSKRQQWENAERLRQFFRHYSDGIRLLLASWRSTAWSPQRLVIGELQGADEAPPMFCRISGGAEPGSVTLDAMPAEELGRHLVEETVWPRNMPPYLSANLWIDGMAIGERSGARSGSVLALSVDAEYRLRAEVVLADSSLLLAPVADRSRRAAILIALAAAAAAAGWFAAWRAFNRQRQLSAMKDNFVSAVSHELKAPVAAIGLMAEELERGSASSDSKRQEYARLIAGECARLGSLVENVLDYARFESDSDGFEFEEADIGELVRAAVDLLRPAAAKRDMPVRVEAPAAGDLTSEVDARALGRALVNLLDNAIKYAPPGSPIEVSAERAGAAGLRLTVADRGEPIPMAERRQIFDRFYRSGSELTREAKGVGIGLSLVRHIARAHGGRAFVESDRGGNRFIIETHGNG